MSHSGAGKKYRVAQWATGNVGSRSMRRVIEHPDMELVGVWVHGADKVGQDAGVLAGIEPIGVKATNTLASIIDLKPDCVMYMPHVCNFDDVCAILESGANIVSTRMELQNPKALDAALYARLESACQKGNSSLHATGSSPGFITEAMPIVLASIQRHLEHLHINEFADCSSRNSPEMIFQMMGFGQPPGQANAAQLHHTQTSFAPSLQLIATAFGVPIEEFKTFGAQGVARIDVNIAAGLVPAGTVAATKTTLQGLRGGKPIMSFTCIWYVSSDVITDDGEDWNFRDSGWRVLVEGDCPLDVSISFPVALENYAAMTPGLTAHRPVNAVPYVCEAPPGIQTTVDLPQIITRLQ